MLVRVEAALELDPEIEVADVTLTIGHDNLSHGENNVHYGQIGLLGAGWRRAPAWPPASPATRGAAGRGRGLLRLRAGGDARLRARHP